MSEVFTSTPHGRLNLECRHVNGCAFEGESGVESSFINVQTSDKHTEPSADGMARSHGLAEVFSLATSGFASGSC